MKTYARQASVRWCGTGQRGKGTVSTPSAALNIALHATGGDRRGRGTNPSELIAAAHAGSFSLTLAHELAEAGYSPRQIDTTATVTTENTAAGWAITRIDLDVVAAVPRAAECDFVDAVLQAKANCPVSRALNAIVSMRSRMSRREAPPRLKRRGTSVPRLV